MIQSLSVSDKCSESVATSDQSVATVVTVATEDQTTPISVRDEELKNFGKRVDELSCTSATKAHIKELFRRYGYDYTFRSGNVADIFGVKTPGGASAILRKLMLKYNLVESPQYGIYRFIKR